MNFSQQESAEYRRILTEKFELIKKFMRAPQRFRFADLARMQEI